MQSLHEARHGFVRVRRWFPGGQVDGGHDVRSEKESPITAIPGGGPVPYGGGLDFSR